MKNICIVLTFIFSINSFAQDTWQSERVKVGNDGKLDYIPDHKGNILPDFSRVGYLEGEEPPTLSKTIELQPQQGDDKNRIQAAIDELAFRQADSNGFKGCLLLKAGTYEVSDQLSISSSGIVIRGEGNHEQGTIVIATGRKKYSLFEIKGEGAISEIERSRVNINMPFVPVGTKKLVVENADSFKKDDWIIVFRPSTAKWISDIKMDQITARADGGTITQWKAGSYDFRFERKVENIVKDTLYIDNPIVMEMETKYGGGEVYKYVFEGRIRYCGIENLLCISEYISETDEDHGWDAVKIEKAEHCWVRNVTAKYFGYSAVNISSNAKNISVLNCKCLEAKSKITGGRRYSFNCNGQLNLIKNCETTEGRHDFVTGSRVCGPNVFTQCTASNTHSDIGPHHRWAMGTLFDVIETDGTINAQDRGNYGSGHGWAGANQVLWNCMAAKISCQSPWVSAKNYAIGCHGTKSAGRYPDRPDGEWEGFNKQYLEPESLYEAQLVNRKNAVLLKIEKHCKLPNDTFFCYATNKKVVIQLKSNNKNIESVNLYDLYGRLIHTANPFSNRYSAQLNELSAGIYLVSLNIEGQRSVKKLIIDN